MKKPIIILISILLPLYAMAQTAEECYKKGQDYFEAWNGVVLDQNEAYKWFIKAADQGYAPAMSKIANMYYYGQGLAVDYIECLKWANKAVGKNDALGYTILAHLYYYGRGVNEDKNKAWKYYKKSAEMGCTDALVSMSIIYSVWDKNYSKALKLLHQAIDKGNYSAAGLLSFWYQMKGCGLTYNPEEIYKWAKKAADLGGLGAIARVGWCYRDGIGVTKNYDQAYKWYKIAADRGYVDSMISLGEMYENGLGVSQELYTAKTWYEKALKFSVSPATKNDAKRHLSKLEQKEPNLFKNSTPSIQDTPSLAQNSTSSVQNKPSYAQNSTPSVKNKPQLQKPAQQQQETVGFDIVDIGIPTSGRVNRNTFAIIIANEDYQQESKVDYAKNDGEVFKAYCNKTLGLPEKNIHFVANATLNNLIGELDWVQQVCDAYGGDASIIFYYAGHGIPDEASGASFLIPIDGNSRILRTCFSTNELYESLGKLPAKKVTVLMDACFSGAVRSGGMLAAARGVAIKAKTSAPKGNMIVLTAAQGEETAYKYDEAKHGLFTYFLLKKLKDSKGDVTFGELSRYITEQVKRLSIVENGKKQTPSVMTSVKLKPIWETMKFD